LARQLLRSATSIGANYREANRGVSRADFANKIGTVQKEAAETQYWLELLLDSELAGSGNAQELLILIPGLAADHSCWRLMIPRLAAEYTVVAVDNRGAGRTSDAGRFFSIEDMADDIVALAGLPNATASRTPDRASRGRTAWS